MGDDWRGLEVEELEGIDALSREEFEQRYQFARPVLIKGAARTMPAGQSWTIDVLLKRIGGNSIEVLDYSEKAPNDYTKAKRIKMTFRDFVDAVEAGNRSYYLFNTPDVIFWGSELAENDRVMRPNKDLESLRKDFSIPSFIDPATAAFAALIVGWEHNATPLHHDFGGEGKCLIQVHGSKDVLLFAPEQAGNLYLEPALKGRVSLARVDVRRPDLEKFPKLAQVKGVHVNLEAGDILYWPNYWFHDIENTVGPSIAINFGLDDVKVKLPIARQLAMVYFTDWLMKMRTRTDIDPDTFVRMLDAFDEVDQELIEKHSTPEGGRLWHWRPKLEFMLEVRALRAKSRV